MLGGQEKNFSTLGPKLRGSKAQQYYGDKQRQIRIEMIVYKWQHFMGVELQIISRMESFINISETPLLHRSSDMLTSWRTPSASPFTRALRGKDGKSRGKWTILIKMIVVCSHN